MEVTAGFAQLKNGLRATWMAGDFGRIAEYSTKAAEEFVDRLNIVAGMKVLDVACGTGNTAIPAARKGAQVIGVDIAPNLLEQARRRAAVQGLTVSFDEGDAESLPYADAQFDLVISMFGGMFAPRPEQVAAELTRVCRSGGVVAMANWTPGSFAGQMFALTASYVPPPEGIPPPVLWGKAEVVQKRFAVTTTHVETVLRTIDTEFPFEPHVVVELFREYFGPTQMAFSRLDPTRQVEYATEMEHLWRQNNTLDNGNTKISNEYLEVIATRV